MKREAHNGSLEYNGQAAADKFVLNCTNFKRNGYFLELGSRHFKNNNNSYILEKTFNWKGVMVEYDRSHLTDYKTHRSNSIHIMEDARLIDYRKIFEENDFPLDLDFWQLDLYTSDNSAYETLTKINEEILNDYKFATQHARTGFFFSQDLRATNASGDSLNEIDAYHSATSGSSLEASGTCTKSLEYVCIESI